jgi:hypothetical protein
LHLPSAEEVEGILTQKISNLTPHRGINSVYDSIFSTYEPWITFIDQIDQCDLHKIQLFSV